MMHLCKYDAPLQIWSSFSCTSLSFEMAESITKPISILTTHVFPINNSFGGVNGGSCADYWYWWGQSKKINVLVKLHMHVCLCFLYYTSVYVNDIWYENKNEDKAKETKEGSFRHVLLTRMSRTLMFYVAGWWVNNEDIHGTPPHPNVLVITTSKHYLSVLLYKIDKNKDTQTSNAIHYTYYLFIAYYILLHIDEK